MTNNNRGSKRLIGAASLRYRMPVIVGVFLPLTGYSSLVEQQPQELCVAGSNPAIQPSVKR